MTSTNIIELQLEFDVQFIDFNVIHVELMKGLNTCIRA